MRCSECDKEASYSIEFGSNGLYSGRTTVWKYLCKDCYKKIERGKQEGK